MNTKYLGVVAISAALMMGTVACGSSTETDTTEEAAPDETNPCAAEDPCAAEEDPCAAE